MLRPEHARFEIALRESTPADRDFLLLVYASTRAEEMAMTGWPQEQKTAFLVQQFQAQDTHYRTHYGGAQFQVVEIDGAAAGRLYWHEAPDELCLMDVALLPQWQRQGIGNAVMKVLVERAVELNRPIGLHVERENPAKRLYERYGFCDVEERGFYVYMRFSPAA
jgi:ribosomal protein S18 acetylase RimI-like enzyme